MAENVKLLLVEDHRDIAEMTLHYLQGRGYITDYAGDGVTGLHLAVNEHYDIIVLDLSLPGMDGIEVCRNLREKAMKDTPIIMLTARDTLDDKITGLDVGADDYLVKPFAVAELEARIRAQVRRTQAEVVREKIRIGELVFNKSTLQVIRDGIDIQLTPIGYKILDILMQSSPGVVSRREIERKVWGDILPDSDALRSHMYALRKKIDKPFSYAMIKNSPGNGYKITDEKDSTQTGKG